MSGTGFFTRIEIPPYAPRLPITPSVRISDVDARLDDLKHGAGFVLFFEDGVLTMLEGVSYDEPWPVSVGEFELEYCGGKARHLAALCEAFGATNSRHHAPDDSPAN